MSGFNYNFQGKGIPELTWWFELEDTASEVMVSKIENTDLYLHTTTNPTTE